MQLLQVVVALCMAGQRAHLGVDAFASQGHIVRRRSCASTTRTPSCHQGGRTSRSRCCCSNRSTLLLATTRAAIAIGTAGSEDGVTARIDYIPPTNPRAWLESQPFGAYTVMRCDYAAGEKKWTIWGRDFHLQQRLQESYRSLLLGESLREDLHGILAPFVVETATQQTAELVDSLLSLVPSELGLDGALHETTTLVMITVLWYPDSEGTIRVQGHACPGTICCRRDDINDPFSPYDPEPWTLVVDNSNAGSGPSRQPFPLAKLSAWCSQRRPLEELFLQRPQVLLRNADFGKKEAVSVNEVILTCADGGLALLEGLTSNLFVVYPNNVIRTAGDGVLHGYARHLVMEALADNDAWTVDTVTPIRIDEANYWQQIFCTSAIRLVVPVGRILAPCTAVDCENSSELCEVWRMSNADNQPSVWTHVYDSVLKLPR